MSFVHARQLSSVMRFLDYLMTALTPIVLLASICLFVMVYMEIPYLDPSYGKTEWPVTVEGVRFRMVSAFICSFFMGIMSFYYSQLFYEALKARAKSRRVERKED